MTGPVRDDMPEHNPPDDDFDAAPPAGNDYQGEGFDLGLEDIAIVAWEAVRAYRATQGNHTMKGWMHASEPDKARMVARITYRAFSDPDHEHETEPEKRLIQAIHKALTPDP